MKHKTHHFANDEEHLEETISEYMTTPVQSVTGETTILEVSQLMAEKNIGSVLVKNGGDYIGIITERDLTRKVIGQGLDPKTTPVTETMSSPLITLEGSEPVTEANQFMAKHKIRHLAVTVEGKISGILSVKDLVAFYANPRLRH
ncbi:MAG: CBS domain-containing protein [Nitrospinae bacterium]|nr:CBS domain-containing protein [Nitrospinota bacterium]